MLGKILVHCCCGPCATSSLQRLIDEGWSPVLYFKNSNIFPKEENDKRYGELEKVAGFYNLPVIREEYNHEEWLEFVKGLENEKEHGKRCLKCFEFNLKEACSKAKELGIEHFTTTLTVSRFKNSADIFKAGNNFDGFEAVDFKKKDGFSKSIKLSGQLGLYRQQYCGCEFSMKNAENENAL